MGNGATFLTVERRGQKNGTHACLFGVRYPRNRGNVFLPPEATSGTISCAQHGDGACLRRAGASFCILLSTMEQNNARDGDVRTQEAADAALSAALPAAAEAGAKGAKAGPPPPSGKVKKSRRWCEADDYLAMKAAVSASAHVAPRGTRTKRFAAAAESFNSHPQVTTKTDGKHLRDRFCLLKDKFEYDDRKEAAQTGTEGAVTKLDDLLIDIVEKVNDFEE